MKILLVVKYYLMNINFKFHKDLSFHWGDMAKICTAGVFAQPPESSAQDPPPWIGLSVKYDFPLYLLNDCIACMGTWHIYSPHFGIESYVHLKLLDGWYVYSLWGNQQEAPLKLSDGCICCKGIWHLHVLSFCVKSGSCMIVALPANVFEWFIHPFSV